MPGAPDASPALLLLHRHGHVRANSRYYLRITQYPFPIYQFPIYRFTISCYLPSRTSEGSCRFADFRDPYPA